MDAEVMKERLDALFKNKPSENIEHLPPDIQGVIDNAIIENARLFLERATLDGSTEEAVRMAMCGAIGQAFFAGHNYAVEHGNLMAEMKKVS